VQPLTPSTGPCGQTPRFERTRPACLPAAIGIGFRFMMYSRPFILLLATPVLIMLALAAVIFGGQVIADSRRDQQIQQTIAASLKTSGQVELLNLQDVQYGYGVCGLYRTSDSDKGYASFFYDTVNDRLSLDVKSRAFQSNCNLSDLCS